jgi:mannose-1-phosphate guanylyltransferase
MIVVAADHYIEDEIEWLNVFSAGAMAAKDNDRIIVFGVVPQKAHTGYGYVQYGSKTGSYEDNSLYKVDCFKEKPDIETAREYVKSGDFFWNSGCFAWMPRTILSLVNKHMPELEKIISRIIDSSHFEEAMIAHYGLAPNISIDYGILEHADNIFGMKLDAGWNDVGSWASLFEVLPADEDGNVISGDRLILRDCKNSLFWSEDQLLTAIGLDNMIVVQSGGAIMVSPRDRGEEVKELVTELKKKGLKEFL